MGGRKGGRGGRSFDGPCFFPFFRVNGINQEDKCAKHGAMTSARGNHVHVWLSRKKECEPENNPHAGHHPSPRRGRAVLRCPPEEPELLQVAAFRHCTALRRRACNVQLRSGSGQQQRFVWKKKKKIRDDGSDEDAANHDSTAHEGDAGH